MADPPDQLLAQVRTNSARRAALAAEIDRDIAELVETHRMSARRLAKELNFRSDNSVRLAVRRFRQRQVASEPNPEPPVS